MCLALYLVSASPLQPAAAALIGADSVDPDLEVQVRRWLGPGALYLVDAGFSCSCVFRHVIAEEVITFFPGMFDAEDSNDRQRSTLAARHLLEVTRQLRDAGVSFSLFPVFSGDEALRPRGEIQFPRVDLDPDEFFFCERFLYRDVV